MSIRLDYLGDPSIQVYQEDTHFKMNTDTRLLANFVHPRKNDRIMDIGTNNGALLVALDKKPCKELIGVEILQEPFLVAQKNVNEFISHPCTLYNVDVKELDIEPVDLIVSNPPYFPLDATHPDTQINMRQLGRVEYNLDLEGLVQSAFRLLKSNGRFCFVHRPDRIHEIMICLYKYHFQCKRLAFAYDHRDGQVKSLLIEAIKESNCSCPIESPIYIDAL